MIFMEYGKKTIHGQHSQYSAAGELEVFLNVMQHYS